MLRRDGRPVLITSCLISISILLSAANSSKEIQPYYPGEEEELREELGRVEMMIEFVKQNRTFDR